MRRLTLALTVLLALCDAARAQTGCTVQTQAQLLQAMRDNAPPGSITPQVLRNLVCTALIGGGSATAMFASPPPLGNVTRNTGAFTTLSATGAAALAGGGTLNGTFAGNPTFSGSGTGLAVTNNVTIGGTFKGGTGTLAASAHAFEVNWNADPSTAGGDTRQNMFNTTLTFSGNTTNFWGNLSSFLTVNGPGHANQELNLVHSLFTLNAGGTVSSVENYEANVDSFGTVGTFTNYLGLYHNHTAATATYISGANFYLTNDNATAGSIFQWSAITVAPMQGAGSAPTFYSAIDIQDANAGIATLGGIIVGARGNATPGQLLVKGVNNSGGTFPLLYQNLAGNVFYFANDATANFVRAGVTIQPSTVGPNFTLIGSDNSGATFQFSLKNLAGTSILAVSNAGVINMASSAVTIQPPASGPTLFVQGTDNSSATFPVAVKNLAASTLFSIADNGSISFGAAGVTVQPGSVGPIVNVQGADNSGGTFALTAKNLAAANLFSVANNGDISAGVTGRTFGITGALTVSQNIATSGGVYFVGAAAGVNCPAGVTAGTVVVVGGIVTHC